MEAFAISATTISPLSPLSSSITPRLSLLNPNPNRNNLRLHRTNRRPISAIHGGYGGYGGDGVIKATGPQTQETAMRAAEGDVMGLLFKERIVFLGSSINDFVADAIISQLLLLDAIDPTRDIRLFINSTGGSLSATLGIYDVLQVLRADVSTIAIGIAASTASIILGGGTKGKRLAMPNTRIMFHQPYGGSGGQVDDVEVQTREIMQNKNSVIQIVSGFTGRSLEQVEKDMDMDCYMSPIEALEYGFIDGIVDRDSVIPLEPVPDQVEGTLNITTVKDKKFWTPEIPDDEIY